MEVPDPLHSEEVREDGEEGSGPGEQACTSNPGSDPEIDGSESGLTDDGSEYLAPTMYGY